MPLEPQCISVATKTWSPIHRDSYVSTVDIDILYGDGLKKIGEGKVYRVRTDRIINEGVCSFLVVFDGHSSDLSSLYEELFEDEELIPDVEDELKYRGQGLGGILALAIAERFDERDIVALKPWPMTADDPENVAGVWELPRLSQAEQKTIAGKLRKTYQKAGFKPLFKGSEHLFLTHLRHPKATQLIDKMEMNRKKKTIG